MTDPKNADRDPRVIDLKQARKNTRVTRRRRRKTALLAAAAAALLLLAAALVSQIGEVLDAKDFWNNFASSAAQER